MSVSAQPASPIPAPAAAPLRPEHVRAALSGIVSARACARLLAALRADPAWHVLEPLARAGPPEAHEYEWVFQVVYRPTGTPCGFPARRVGPDAWDFGPRSSWLGTAQPDT